MSRVMVGVTRMNEKRTRNVDIRPVMFLNGEIGLYCRFEGKFGKNMDRFAGSSLSSQHVVWI